MPHKAGVFPQRQNLVTLNLHDVPRLDSARETPERVLRVHSQKERRGRRGERPSLKLGADVVMHSMTKYLGGHSDVQGGALIFRKRHALVEAVERTRQVGGGVASPFNSWLILRGIRTLAARVRVQCANAQAVAEFLAQHPRVEAVHDPGLPSHPGHDVAKRQMRGFGGMLSFRVRGGRDAAIEVTKKVKLFTVATSLGGIESLIEHRASIEGAASLSPQNLLRVSIGLDLVDDLIEDLRQALAQARKPALHRGSAPGSAFAESPPTPASRSIRRGTAR